MVAHLRLSAQEEANQDSRGSDVKWSTIVLQEVVEKEYRLEASVYGIEGRQARQNLQDGRWNVVPLCGENGLATCYHRPRFKRVFVEKSDFPIYQPAQVNEVYPRPSAYISELTRTNIDALRVKKGQILLTCSGTIGNCTFVRNTQDSLIFSHDLIRVEPKEYNGFIYAFLKSSIGRLLLTTNNYGAVIKHIEPKHLDNIPIPNPPVILKQGIHNLVEESFRLRDESNELMDETQILLKEALRLPAIEELHAKATQFDKMAGVLNYSVPLSNFSNRLDGSYHVPIVSVIEQHLNSEAKEVARLDDSRLSQSVILPGRFKRVYVEEGNGVVFLGGKQIFELNPSNKTYLSTSQHGDRIRLELILRENMTLITSRGTIGRATLVPKHWDGWTASDNIIRILNANIETAGYLYAWLSSPFGYVLINRFTCGGLVDMLEPVHVRSVIVPLLKDEDIQTEINNSVLEANRKRTEAYELEQEALTVLNEKVIFARSRAK